MLIIDVTNTWLSRWKLKVLSAKPDTLNSVPENFMMEAKTGSFKGSSNLHTGALALSAHAHTRE